jgi:Co/Zn/Cd efflux system component
MHVDTALEADARGRRALWISLAALTATAMLQALVVVFTGSVALLGDTLHNVADAATAVHCWWRSGWPDAHRTTASRTATVAPRTSPGSSSSP